ncbi:MAG: IS110 family transposase, partial [Acidobacteria bacterium]|nr:IS110 family transposase [Acidobacteriota bacterium]
MIPAVIERCAGIDIGKKFVVVCLMTGKADAEAAVEIRKYGTVNCELESLSRWLQQSGCTHIVMESTGSYWVPVFNILEQHFTIVLANPMEVRQRRGHKTDWKDSQWMAHLLRHNLLRSSFIPPRPFRDLRGLTRQRKQLVRHLTQEKNRVQKTLEEANIKLGSVLSDVFGKSGQAMLAALLDQDQGAREMAQLAQGKAKNKRLELEAALEGHRLTDPQRSRLRHSLRHMEFLRLEILALDDEIRRLIQELGQTERVNLLLTIPGVQETTAYSIVAELGPEIRQFPTAGHLSSWAGLCP